MRSIFALLLGWFAVSTTLSAQTNPCLSDTTFHIVVLGSSTAAGAGASTPDSAWVNRYRAALQAINPGNQVTNRAQGGFTTYQLMPDNFTPPAGRPAPNTTRNITYALSLNPSAIIVNLPSNDVASGYSVQEQLDNFDTIVAHANAAGVPIWICTTQPRNFGNASYIQYQQDVRDSIHARYSPRVLDFWSGLPDATHQIDPYYDSGDGVHLNNRGHALLEQRAHDGDLLGELYIPYAGTDYVLFNLQVLSHSVCGDSASVFQAHFHNRGALDGNPLGVVFSATHLPSGNVQTGNISLSNPTQSCETDALQFTINTTVVGAYQVEAIVQNTADTYANNDTVAMVVQSLGQPTLTTFDGLGCINETQLLLATAASGDTVYWYDAPAAGTPVGTGTVYQTPALTATTTFYAAAARGIFHHVNEITTTTQSNINFNGTMFDVVADSALVIDSIALKIATIGPQVVEVYTRWGSHLGHETNPGAWMQWGSFNVQVNDPQQLSVFAINPLPVPVGDTFAVYVQLQDAASNLSYQSVPNPITRTTSELTLITGSGISHNFGNNYYPRDAALRLYYHYGNKPEGDCISPRVPAVAVVGDPQVDLGADTIVGLTATVTLDAGSGFTAYQWSDGSTSSTFTADGNTLGMGIYTFWVTVTDSLGCQDTDSVIVVFAPLAGVEEQVSDEIGVYPNPVVTQLHFSEPLTGMQYVIYSVDGRLVCFGTLSSSALDVQQLAPAGYVLHVFDAGASRHYRQFFIKQ